MQAVAAAHMLSVLPPGLLHDPFVGGGTTLVEGLRCGRHVIGADVSPLALFASTHHTWLASEDELEALRHDATSAISAVDHTWHATKDQVEALRQDAETFYLKNEAEAVKVISVGESRSDPKIAPAELATWTLVVSSMFNLDEALTK
jgi:hypothetical protein